jgi:LmbE family N-acetylglucosaminyl deacetylase
VTDAVVAARDPHFFAEQGLAHHRPEELLLFEADEPNHAEPTSEEWLQVKLAALEAHESQVETTHLYNLDAASRGDAIIAFHARERAKLESAGAPFGIELAESFHRMDGL